MWHFRPFFVVAVAKLLQIFKRGLPVALQLVREFFGFRGRFRPGRGSPAGKFSEDAAAPQYALFLCAGPQSVPDLLSGFGLPGAPVIMGIDLQRHVHGAVASQVLNLLDVQSGLEQPSDIGVTKDMCRDVRVRQFPLDQPPHAPVRGFRQRLMVLHGNHILGVRGLLSLGQPRFQFVGKRKVPLSGLRLQFFGNRSRVLTDHRIMSDMDDFGFKVDVLPLEAKDLASPHPGMEIR